MNWPKLTTASGLASCLMVLAGCAVRAPVSPTAVEKMPIAQWSIPAFPERWQLNGRAALQLKEQALSASVQWRERPAHYRIDLRGGLGAGNIRVVGDDTQVVLTRADGERLTASNPEELIRATTGYELPISLLRWWVTGRPAPWLEGEVVVDADGRAQWLEQAGWQVVFDRYTAQSGYALPGRLALSRHHVEVRFAIQSWQLQ